MIELFEILPEGILCEVIENKLYMTPAPDFFHQKLTLKLSVAIFNDGKKYRSRQMCSHSHGSLLDDSNAHQPDILLIAKENLGII
ncbi:MAG: hypothetical protein ABIS01_17135, partial [Ferruginibacter sp.]